MDPRAEGDVAVRRARDVEPVGIGERVGIAVGGADADGHLRPRRERDAGDLARSRRDPVAELVRALEAEELLDGRSHPIGILAQACPLVGPVEQAGEAVADQVGRRLVAGVEQEDAVVQQLGRAQRLAALAGDEARQHVDLRVAGLAAAALDEALEVEQELANARLPSSSCSPLGAGSRAPRIASDQSRSGARSSSGTASRLPMISTGIALANEGDQVDLGARRARGDDVEQAVDALDEPALHRRDVARRQRSRDQAAYPRVQRRVVEDQARRVMLEERRRTVLGQELLALVRAEGRAVLVDGDDVGVAAQEDAAVGHPLDRGVPAQGAIRRVRIVVEALGQALQVEVVGEVAVVGHGAESTVWPGARRPPARLRRGSKASVEHVRKRPAAIASARYADAFDTTRGRRPWLPCTVKPSSAGRRPKSGTRSPTSARCTPVSPPASSPTAGSSRARASSRSPTAWSRASSSSTSIRNCAASPGRSSAAAQPSQRERASDGRRRSEPLRLDRRLPSR
jgi:hypothetical protein